MGAHDVHFTKRLVFHLVFFDILRWIMVPGSCRLEMGFQTPN